MAGIARTLQYLPKDDPKRPFYIHQLQEMAARIAQLQGSDGLWTSALLDPADYPQPEISGSALIPLRHHLGRQRAPARRHEIYALSSTRPGAACCIMSTPTAGSAPFSRPAPEPAYYLPGSSYNYGVGGYLLAASELKRLALKEHQTKKRHAPSASN